MYGTRAADDAWRVQASDAMTLQRLLWVRTDVGNLSLLRQGKVEEVIRGMENVVDSGVKTIDMERAKVAPMVKPDLEKTREAFLEYTKAYPGTQLDPKKNDKVGMLLSK